MENQEPETKPKLIFGLSPAATLLNAIIFLTLAGVFWTMYFVNQLPAGVKLTDDPTTLPKVSVPWYVDSPLFVLSIVMILSWADYYFKIKKGDLSRRTIVYKYVYPFAFIILYHTVIKFITLTILL